MRLFPSIVLIFVVVALPVLWSGHDGNMETETQTSFSDVERLKTTIEELRRLVMETKHTLSTQMEFPFLAQELQKKKGGTSRGTAVLLDGQRLVTTQHLGFINDEIYKWA